MEVKKLGRPRKFDTPEQMQEAIDDYFNKCDSKTTRKLVFKGTLGGMEIEEVPDPVPYTIEGLCRSIGCTRQTLSAYLSKYPEFSDTIKEARECVAESTNSGILSGKLNSTAGIFNLTNNFGYKNEYIHEVKQERVISGMSKDQIAEILSDEE